jgi:16S rRNA (adenine(1408)-N(1))-methyltransferase
LIARADRVVMDLGTGDGRAVLARASADPTALVIGIDAAGASMAEASRRADRRGPRNTLFIAAGAEVLASTPFAGEADLVTVTLPWGSLLRGALGVDGQALGGIASTLRPGGRLELLASVVPSDRVDGIDCLDDAMRPAIADAWRGVGLQLSGMRPATADDLATSGSSWARRLGAGRPVWRIDGVRSASIEP